MTWFIYCFNAVLCVGNIRFAPLVRPHWENHGTGFIMSKSAPASLQLSRQVCMTDHPPPPHGAVTSNKEEQGVLWTDSLGPSGESWPHRHWVMSGINTHTLQWTHTHTSLMLTRTAVSSTEQPETVGLSGPKFPKCHVSSLRRHGTVGVHREFIPKKKYNFLKPVTTAATILTSGALFKQLVFLMKPIFKKGDNRESYPKPLIDRNK